MNMINNQRIVFIPVRKGSKGIPGKNLRQLFNKPLIDWILDTLLEKPVADEIWVATNCPKMKHHIAANYPTVKVYEREAQNAQDQSPTIDVVLEFINKRNLDRNISFMIAQATVPFTSHKDFKNGFLNFESGAYDSLLACKRIKSFVWDKQGNCLSYSLDCKPRRQEYDGILIESGAFYISDVGGFQDNLTVTFGKVGVYELEPGISIDIDEESDWAIAETLIQLKQNKE